MYIHIAPSLLRNCNGQITSPFNSCTCQHYSTTIKYAYNKKSLHLMNCITISIIFIAKNSLRMTGNTCVINVTLEYYPYMISLMQNDGLCCLAYIGRI